VNFVGVQTDLIRAVVGKEEMQLASFDKRINSKKIVLISIQDPDDPINLNTCHKKWKDFIHLQFFDVTEPTLSSGKTLNPISEEQAKELISFILDNKNEQFFIHCEAGVSRSAGVAMALECILKFDGNKNNFNLTPHPVISHWRYTPNYFVFDTIVDLYNNTKSSFIELVCPYCNCSIEKPIVSSLNGSICPFCFKGLKNT